MRLFEWVMYLVAVPILVDWIFYKNKRKSKLLIQMGYICGGIGVSALLIHLFTEGYRLQMVPLYILSIWVLVQSLRRASKPSSKWLYIRRRKLTILLLAFILAFPILLPVFSFPAPGGPLKVGVTKLHLVNQKKKEIIPGHEDKQREMMLSVWYPANAAGTENRPWTFFDIMHQIMRADGFPTFSYQYFKYIDTHSIENVEIAKASAKYPVILFLHGFPGMSTQSIPLVEELASQGYVVVAPDFTHVSAAPEFPDGRVVTMEKGLLELQKPQLNQILKYWVQDISFIIDELEQMNLSKSNHILAGKLDLNQVGVLGHSFGGSTAMHALLADDRVAAGMSMDAPAYGDMSQDMVLTKPFLIMDASESDWDMDVKRGIFKNMTAEGYMVMLDGADHDSFTNYPLESPLFASLFINKYHAHQLINEYAVAFFDRHLLGKDGDLLDQASHDPKVSFQTN